MKTAIYITNGTTQIVLTPETNNEKSLVPIFQNKDQKTTIFIGQFYECDGGWYRQGSSKDSLIIRLDPAQQCSD